MQSAGTIKITQHCEDDYDVVMAHQALSFLFPFGAVYNDRSTN